MQDTLLQQVKNKIWNTAQSLNLKAQDMGVDFKKMQTNIFNATPIGQTYNAYKAIAPKVQPAIDKVSNFIKANPAPTPYLANRASKIMQNVGSKIANYQTPDVQGNVPGWLKPFNDVYKSQLELSKQLIDPMVRSYGNTTVRMSEPQKLSSTYGKDKWALGEDVLNVLPVLPLAAFSKTKPITNLLKEKMMTAKSPQEAVGIIHEVTDALEQSAKKTGNVNNLKALRAGLTKEIERIVGRGGAGYKSDYALRKTLLNDPDVGNIISTIEDRISGIDDQIKSFIKPVVSKVEELYHGSPLTGLKELKSGKGNFGEGVYLTNSVDDARKYASGWSGGVDPAEFNAIKPENIYKVTLDKIKLFKTELMSLEPEEISKIRQQGFEGIQTPYETVVFNPKKVKIKNTLPEFKYNPIDKLDRLPPPSVLRKTPGFTNVKEIDNPLLKGKAFMDTLKEANIQKDPFGLTPLAKKINLWDKLFATPDRVMEKIGLKPQMTYLRSQFDKYTSQLPEEIGRVTAWSKRVTPESNEQIFDWLDGKPVQLNGENLKVATEIKGYLKTWAQKLELPEEKRISNYITHIFKKGTQLEFDEDLAKLIDEKVASSVYDPFLQARKGNPEYLRDTWRALDAYVKRATRKYNLDPALTAVENASKDFELSQFKYVKGYIDRINLRPTEIDTTIDNSIKQLIGYRFGDRPLTALTRTARQAVFRGLIGLNPGTALRNLSQGANTYAKLGERYTVTGYVDYLKSVLTKSDELEKSGVLSNSFIQDRTISATKKLWEYVDKGLFFMFDTAEKINRGSAYFGAKAQALAKGQTEREAIEYAKKMVRDTQFVFGSIDTPPAMQSDIGKTLLQMQSFTVKQLEFLGDMVKSKDVAGLTRYTLASLVFATTIGKLFGMKLTDLIPSVRFGAPPTMQLPVEVYNAVTDRPGFYGNKLSVMDKLQNIGSAAMNYIPAGGQIKKTYGGLKPVIQGYETTKSGLVKYPVKPSFENYVRGALFGGYNLPEAKQYKAEGNRYLSEKQSEVAKLSGNIQSYYQIIMDKRKETAADTAIKNKLEETGSGKQIVGNTVYYLDNGSAKKTDLSYVPSKPSLTGDFAIDKQLLSHYRSDLTRQRNEIIDLVGKGIVDLPKVREALGNLQEKQVEATAPKAGRKLTMQKITLRKMKKLSFGKSKKIRIPKLKKLSRLKKIKLLSVKPLKLS